jgi:hypothetical protein
LRLLIEIRSPLLILESNTQNFRAEKITPIEQGGAIVRHFLWCTFRLRNSNPRCTFDYCKLRCFSSLHESMISREKKLAPQLNCATIIIRLLNISQGECQSMLSRNMNSLLPQYPGPVSGLTACSGIEIRTLDTPSHTSCFQFASAFIGLELVLCSLFNRLANRASCVHDPLHPLRHRTIPRSGVRLRAPRKETPLIGSA